VTYKEQDKIMQRSQTTSTSTGHRRQVKSAFLTSAHEEPERHDENLLSAVPLPPCCTHVIVGRSHLDTRVLASVSASVWEYE